MPLGIDFKACDDASNVPYADGSFDMIINRHGDFDSEETARLLRPDGLFITEQVGGENDRDLVEMVLPDVPKPFPELELSIQKKKFEDAGLKIIRAQCFHIMIFIRYAFVLKTDSCLFNHFIDISKLHSGKIINIDFHIREKIYKLGVFYHFTNQADIKLSTFQ